MEKKTNWLAKFSLGLSLIQGLGNIILWFYAINYLFTQKYNISNGLGVCIFIIVNIVLIAFCSLLLNFSTRPD